MSDLLVDSRDRVVVLTLNRPGKLNAITHAMAEEISTALSAADADPDVGAVVITGTGERAFCAGADLAALHKADQVPPDGHDGSGFAGIAHHPLSKPVIAAVNGLAFGGGLEIVLACDLAVAADTATFALPEVRHGLLAAGGGAVRLPAQIPARAAMQMLLTGEPVDALTALRWGLINEVVRPGQALERALGFAGSIADLPSAAVAAARRIVRATPAWAGTEVLWSDNASLLTSTIGSPEARAAAARWAL
jgi:crotonobetainyl-CoA hydratase